MIFFSTRFCAVNFGGIEKISVESKSVFCKFFLLNHRDFTRHKVPHKCSFNFNFNATVQFFTIFFCIIFVVTI